MWGCGCCSHRRVAPGKAAERWFQVMQAWQALIRTVVLPGELVLGLPETRR